MTDSLQLSFDGDGSDSGLGKGFGGMWDGPAPSFVNPEGQSDASIAERFDAFHDANPWIYDALVKLARAWATKNGSDSRIGIKMLFEIVRWQWHMTVADTGEPYRMNNNFTSRYARLIADREPDLAGLFEFRTLRAA